MEIIGLSGYARSGKDEAAKVLVEEFGFTRVAFADKLREFLYALNPMVAYDKGIFKVKNLVPIYEVYVQDVIDKYGWDGYKGTRFGSDVRRLLQRLGTEAGRETMWKNIWIDAAFANLSEDARVVVSDARFFNEFDAIIDRGGEIWRIERKGVGPANNHKSETEAASYKHFALTIHNDGPLSVYQEAVSLAYLKKKSIGILKVEEWT